MATPTGRRPRRGVAAVVGLARAFSGPCSRKARCHETRKDMPSPFSVPSLASVSASYSPRTPRSA